LEKGYDMVEAIQAIAQRRNGTVAQVALAWLLHQPAVTSVIVGARNARQLKDNLGSVELKLDEPELARLDKVSQLAPEYLGWMLAGQGSDRRPGQVRDWSKFMKVKR
jgi:aryl-alcohol dehydrogenase-like predicted oxidoreductase